jgi:hypothetical protein
MTMMKRTAFVCAMAVSLTAVLAGSTSAGPIVPKDAADPVALAARLKAEGWSEVKAGVFEKRGDDKVETVAFGPGAAAHARAQLRKRYNALLRSGKSTSAEGRKALDGIKSALAAIDRDQQEDTVSASACNLDWAVKTRAYPHDGHGPVAYAMARHYNSCGWGVVYTYVHSESNGGEETRTCYDEGWHPKFCERGSEAPGGPPCFSEGYAYAYDAYYNISIESGSTNRACFQ